MSKETNDLLRQLIKMQQVAQRGDDTSSGPPPLRVGKHMAMEVASGDARFPFTEEEESFYQRIKARMTAESPAMVRLLSSKPEMVIQDDREEVKLDATSLSGRVGKLISAGFFGSPRTHGATRSELKRTGGDVNSGNLSKSLAYFVRMGFLTNESDGFKAVPGMKVRFDGK